MENVQAQQKATFDLTTPQGKMKAFNAKSSASASLKDVVGKVLKITGILTHDDVDKETGEVKQIASLFLADGSIVGGQSANIYVQSNELVDMLDGMDIEKNPIEVQILKGKSKAGREFLQLQLVSLG